MTNIPHCYVIRFVCSIATPLTISIYLDCDQFKQVLFKIHAILLAHARICFTVVIYKALESVITHYNIKYCTYLRYIVNDYKRGLNFEQKIYYILLLYILLIGVYLNITLALCVCLRASLSYSIMRRGQYYFAPFTPYWTDHQQIS